MIKTQKRDNGRMEQLNERRKERGRITRRKGMREKCHEIKKGR